MRRFYITSEKQPILPEADMTVYAQSVCKYRKHICMSKTVYTVPITKTRLFKYIENFNAKN